ncbi:MAG TPA: transcription factor FapR [Desulfobacteria bacterium]|nr:transcription factor FapR [Desulfobacteria bacterium]
MARASKKFIRQETLRELLSNNPFLTDGELAEKLAVSIQTIRLDRIILGIPELRERVKQVAEGATAKLKSISGGELVGELLDLELGQQAISTLEISAEMVLAKTKIARGHHLFAQANSLAVAVIDADVALTAMANVKFLRPVGLNEKVIAKAKVTGLKGNRVFVTVHSSVNTEEVFNGEFIIFAKGLEEGLPDEDRG